MSETIERRLPATPGEVPPDVEARAHAGALFALLRWWLEQERPHPPEHMDRLFHALAKRPV